MMSSRWCLAILPAVLTILLCLSVNPVEGVQCYVCSWSPADSGRVDVCTRSNFSESVRTHTCEMGCETVTVYDKNGKLDFFYRNCVGNTTAITNSCHNETSKAITKEICTCNSNYCNTGGDGLTQKLSFVLSAAVLAMMVSIRY